MLRNGRACWWLLFLLFLSLGFAGCGGDEPDSAKIMKGPSLSSLPPEPAPPAANGPSPAPPEPPRASEPATAPMEVTAAEETARLEEMAAEKATTRSAAKNGGSLAIPQFPWPPPHSSARMELRRELFARAGTSPSVLADIDDILGLALDQCGYVERSYYFAPGGFALATRLERIHPDGKPFEPPDRWSGEPGRLHSFDLKAYLRALFTADPGTYRVIVFVVSDLPFRPLDRPPSYAEVRGWLSGGLTALPPEIGQRPYTPGHRVTALVYEFRRDRGGSEPVFVEESRLSGLDHLQKARILAMLEGRP